MTNRKPTPAAKPSPEPKGRPVGSKNVTATAAVLPGRCHECGNTESSVLGYLPERKPEGGKDPLGNPCTHIRPVRVQCSNPKCGAVRLDQRYENVV